MKKNKVFRFDLDFSEPIKILKSMGELWLDAFPPGAIQRASAFVKKLEHDLRPTLVRHDNGDLSLSTMGFVGANSDMFPYWDVKTFWVHKDDKTLAINRHTFIRLEGGVAMDTLQEDKNDGLHSLMRAIDKTYTRKLDDTTSSFPTYSLNGNSHFSKHGKLDLSLLGPKNPLKIDVLKRVFQEILVENEKIDALKMHQIKYPFDVRIVLGGLKEWEDGYEDGNCSVYVRPVDSEEAIYIGVISQRDPKFGRLKAIANSGRKISKGSPVCDIKALESSSGDMRAFFIIQSIGHVYSLIHKQTTEVYHNALNKFKKGFDQDILKELKDLGFVDFPDLHLYNWLASEKYTTSKRYRFQAIESYPVAVSLAFKNPAVTQAIDMGSSLETALADHFKIPVHGVRAMRGLRDDKLREHKLENLPFMFNEIHLARELPFGHWPDRNGKISFEKQWSYFLKVQKQISALDRHMVNRRYYGGPSHKSDERFSVDMMLAQKASWKDEMKIFETPDNESIGMDLVDMTDAFRNQLLMPLMYDALKELYAKHGTSYASILPSSYNLISRSAEGQNSSHIRDLIIRDRTLTRLSEYSDYFHKNDAQMRALIVRLARTRSWEPITDPYTIMSPSGPLIFTPLTDSAQLTEEGDKMDHCVGGYTSQCLRGRTHIVSVRNPEGESLATMEIYYDHDKTLSVSQLKAKSNKTPSEDIRAASKEYMDYIKSAGVVDFEVIQNRIENAEKSENTLEDIIMDFAEYDVSDLSARDAALKAWHFILPKKERSMTYEEWVEHHDLRNKVRSALEYELNLDDAFRKRAEAFFSDSNELREELTPNILA